MSSIVEVNSGLEQPVSEVVGSAGVGQAVAKVSREHAIRSEAGDPFSSAPSVEAS